MSRARAPLLTVNTPFPEARSVLRLLESPGACPKSLTERVFNGTYDKPYIVDSWPWRFLHFDFESVQSAMHMQDPDQLCLAYTRKMMAFLLFHRAPKRILLLGLGGGSLAKYCYRRLPTSAVTVAELNPDVIALREEFRIPEDDERFRVIQADGAAYMAQSAHIKDVILIDACDRHGTTPEFDALEFYQNAYRCLSANGVLATNLCGEWNSCVSHLRKIRATYGDDILALKVRSARNVVVFAFKKRRTEFQWERLYARADVLKRRMGFNFPYFVRRLSLGWSLRKWHVPPQGTSVI